MTSGKFVIDASAWIEYLNGTNLGKRVEKILNNRENVVITPNIVSAEVIRKLQRTGFEVDAAISAIRTLSMSVPEDQTMYFEAGKLHAQMRTKNNNASLADAIIKKVAGENDATIVTKDRHLKGANAILLE